MDTQTEYFRVFPLVVRRGTQTQITVHSLDSVLALSEGKQYTVEIIPMEGIGPRAEHTVVCRNRTLRFSHSFGGEQEYSLCLRGDDPEKPIADLRIYSVDEDLFQRVPLKGCMHCHSDYSDGVEAPAVVAACYRRAGFDYAAITDHGMYAPSLEAMEMFRELDTDFLLFPGEEIHGPGNRVHIIGFAGERSVNEACSAHEDVYRQEVEQIRRELGGCSFDYASSVWVFRKVAEFGGMSILCHPSWVENHAYNIPRATVRRFLAEQPFDVLELINGGNTPSEQTHQISAWLEAVQQGHKISVVGTDDSHGALHGAWFNIGWTYVLTKSGDKDDLIRAMREGCCVAAEQYHGEAPHFYGDPRMVRYCEFLHRSYFPRHDFLCREEGQWMLEHFMGDPDAASRLAALKGQTKRLLAQCYGR